MAALRMARTEMLDLTKRTVIVVDDEAFTRQTVARLLASLGATNVVQAEDGEAALAASWTLDAGPVLVISDLNMPKIDGLNLLKSVRMGQCGLDRAVPFVMLTAFSDRDVVDAALKLDVSAFLLKPVSKAALEKRLNHLARSETEKGWLKSAEIYGTIEIDMAPEVFAPPVEAHGEPPPAGTVKPGARKSAGGAANGGAGGLHRDPEDAAQSMARGPSSASDAGAELLKFLLSNKQNSGTDASRDEAGDAQGRSHLLAIASQDPALAASMAAGIDSLVAEIGESAADRIASALDRLASGDALSPADVVDILRDHGDKVAPDASTVERDWSEQTRSLGDIPKSAISAQNIFLRDGTLLLATGIALAGTPLRVLRRLEGLGILDLPSDPAVGRCLVRLMAPPEPRQPQRPAARTPPRAVAPVRRKGPERSVGPTEIQAGMVLSRDVHTIHGAIYLGAGTTLTERHVGVLESLYEAGKLTSKIWINA
jgi:CheY-like chemotaxis protein